MLGLCELHYVQLEKEVKVDVIILENVYYQDNDIVYHFEREIRKIVLSSNLVE